MTTVTSKTRDKSWVIATTAFGLVALASLGLVVFAIASQDGSISWIIVLVAAVLAFGFTVYLAGLVILSWRRAFLKARPAIQALPERPLFDLSSHEMEFRTTPLGTDAAGAPSLWNSPMLLHRKIRRFDEIKRDAVEHGGGFTSVIRFDYLRHLGNEWIAESDPFPLSQEEMQRIQDDFLTEFILPTTLVPIAIGFDRVKLSDPLLASSWIKYRLRLEVQ